MDQVGADAIFFPLLRSMLRFGRAVRQESNHREMDRQESVGGNVTLPNPELRLILGCILIFPSWPEILG